MQLQPIRYSASNPAPRAFEPAHQGSTGIPAGYIQVPVEAQRGAQLPTQAPGPQPAAPHRSDLARGLAVAGFVTGAVSVILAPFGILSVASNDPRWHNDAVKYSCGTLSIVFGVVSAGLGVLGCIVGARQKAVVESV